MPVREESSTPRPLVDAHLVARRLEKVPHAVFEGEELLPVMPGGAPAVPPEPEGLIPPPFPRPGRKSAVQGGPKPTRSALSAQVRAPEGPSGHLPPRAGLGS
jgi:hypothetical protein